jgi:hypothetical protein
MSWVWILLAVLLVVAALRYRRRLEARRARGPAIDDDAIRRILEEGRIDASEADDGEPLDLDEIAREEEEFWEESWDEPEEYGR